MVEESESHTCGVWLLDEMEQRCTLWLAWVHDRLVTPPRSGAPEADCPKRPAFPCDSMAQHLFDFRPGWTETIEYGSDDPRMPARIREFGCSVGWKDVVATPLVIGGKTLGWMTVSRTQAVEADNHWWRMELIEAIARQA